MMVDSGNRRPNFILDPAQNLHGIRRICHAIPIPNAKAGDHGVYDNHPQWQFRCLQHFFIDVHRSRMIQSNF